MGERHPGNANPRRYWQRLIAASGYSDAVSRVTRGGAAAEQYGVHMFASDGRVDHWLRRGVNIGGVFDDRNSEPAVWSQRDHELTAIASVGFTHVRVPVRWWGHAGSTPPYRIDPIFATEVDRTIDRALHSGLGVVLSMHHADGVMSAEPAQVARVLALWAQVAARYADRRPGLAFDLLNEPRDALTPDRWNDILPLILGAVREIDRTRLVIIGGAQMGTLAGLVGIEPPADDALVLSLHYYEPFAFTHQAAPWESESAGWAGTRWGTASDRQAVTADLEAAARRARDLELPLYVGEFGTFHAADEHDRGAWTAWVRHELERLNLPWAYWDFATDFGLYDRERQHWRSHLLQSLIGPQRRPTGEDLCGLG
ncbi:Cellulase family 5 [Microbacterium pygmaeum]|uniref:Cellulase family 5 n=2 Tax=Microbacterium pygmaeum TaxID=370764 RepID=A0A1G8BK00_9MICO|nr:Cellulase family 5 [Microbacterium pygmaeum]